MLLVSGTEAEPAERPGPGRDLPSRRPTHTRDAQGLASVLTTQLHNSSLFLTHRQQRPLQSQPWLCARLGLA